MFRNSFNDTSGSVLCLCNVYLCVCVIVYVYICVYVSVCVRSLPPSVSAKCVV